jgi:ankyrin repeat protein
MKNDELIEAIQKGDAARVSALIDEDRALPNAKSGNITAVLLALYHGYPEIAQLLVKRGARVSFPEAIALGDAGALKLLDRDPSLMNSFSEDGFPAMGLAVFFRHPELARALIERGADVDAAAKNPQRVAAVHAAATVRDHETMRLLLERGADPNARQQMGFTPFHSAASRGDVTMAKLLMEFGADPRARTEEGRNAIDIAEKYGQPAFAAWFRETVGPPTAI